MSEFLGSRISLISKSDIRYVGILHEINSEDSTVSLENVRSFGTEGRKGKPDEEIPPSSQVYEYIVFRGSDVKDLRIEEAPAANEKPPAVPDDPAILGARPRPANGPAPSGQRGPPGPGGFGQNSYPNNFYPPPMGPWGGRGGPGAGPGPGGFGAMPFPLPGWPYPGQFPAGPGGPGPWNNNFGAFPPGPPGLSGTPGAPGQVSHPGSNAPGPEQKPAPIGAGADKKTGAPGMQDMTSEPKSLGQGPAQQQKPGPPTPPAATKPSAEEVKATTTTMAANSRDPAAQSGSVPTGPSAPTGPKASRTAAAAVAIPMVPKITPTGPSSTKPPGDAAGGSSTAAAIKDATQAAKAAVAMAMAKLDQGASQQNGTGNAMDNLTKKVNEMRVNATRGQSRGRGRTGRPAPAKVDVPDTDFDFASSNAKFNKEDLVKEASSSGPALTNTTNGAGATRSEPSPAEPPAYNKSKSFFDNISSEAKDRAENGGQKPGGREWRGEEQRRNIETFGQGSVDSGYRGYRGRGRGRGGPRGRGYRGGRGGFNRPPRDTPAMAQ